MAAKTLSIMTGIGALQPQPRAWICDIWGVIHNGVAAFPAAVDACLQFRAAGGHILFVSNAPRPSDGVLLQLDAMGVPATAYDCATGAAYPRCTSDRTATCRSSRPWTSR